MDDADLQQRQAILESIARRHFLEHAGELGELRHPDRCLTALWGPLSFKEMKAVLLLTNNEDGACDWDTFRGFVFEDATRYERLAVAKRGLFAELKASWGMASRPAPSSSERRPTFLRAVAGDGDEEGGWGGAGQGSTELADPAGLWGVSSEGGITGKEYSYEEDDDDDEGKGEARGSGGGGGLGVGQDLRQGQGRGQGQGQEQGQAQGSPEHRGGGGASRGGKHAPNAATLHSPHMPLPHSPNNASLLRFGDGFGDTAASSSSASSSSAARSALVAKYMNANVHSGNSPSSPGHRSAADSSSRTSSSKSLIDDKVRRISELRARIRQMQYEVEFHRAEEARNVRTLDRTMCVDGDQDDESERAAGAGGGAGAGLQGRLTVYKKGFAGKHRRCSTARRLWQDVPRLYHMCYAMVLIGVVSFVIGFGTVNCVSRLQLDAAELTAQSSVSIASEAVGDTERAVGAIATALIRQRLVPPALPTGTSDANEDVRTIASSASITRIARLLSHTIALGAQSLCMVGMPGIVIGSTRQTTDGDVKTFARRSWESSGDCVAQYHLFSGTPSNTIEPVFSGALCGDANGKTDEQILALAQAQLGGTIRDAAGLPRVAWVSPVSKAGFIYNPGNGSVVPPSATPPRTDATRPFDATPSTLYARTSAASRVASTIIYDHELTVGLATHRWVSAALPRNSSTRSRSIVVSCQPAIDVVSHRVRRRSLEGGGGDSALVFAEIVESKGGSLFPPSIDNVTSTFSAFDRALLHTLWDTDQRERRIANGPFAKDYDAVKTSRTMQRLDWWWCPRVARFDFITTSGQRSLITVTFLSANISLLWYAGAVSLAAMLVSVFVLATIPRTPPPSQGSRSEGQKVSPEGSEGQAALNAVNTIRHARRRCLSATMIGVLVITCMPALTLFTWSSVLPAEVELHTGVLSKAIWDAASQSVGGVMRGAERNGNLLRAQLASAIRLPSVQENSAALLDQCANASSLTFSHEDERSHVTAAKTGDTPPHALLTSIVTAGRTTSNPRGITNKMQSAVRVVSDTIGNVAWQLADLTPPPCRRATGTGTSTSLTQPALPSVSVPIGNATKKRDVWVWNYDRRLGYTSRVTQQCDVVLTASASVTGGTGPRRDARVLTMELSRSALGNALTRSLSSFRRADGTHGTTPGRLVLAYVYDIAAQQLVATSTDSLHGNALYTRVDCSDECATPPQSSSHSHTHVATVGSSNTRSSAWIQAIQHQFAGFVRPIGASSGGANNSALPLQQWRRVVHVSRSNGILGDDTETALGVTISPFPNHPQWVLVTAVGRRGVSRAFHESTIAALVIVICASMFYCFVVTRTSAIATDDDIETLQSTSSADDSVARNELESALFNQIDPLASAVRDQIKQDLSTRYQGDEPKQVDRRARSVRG